MSNVPKMQHKEPGTMPGPRQKWQHHMNLKHKKVSDIFVELYTGNQKI